MRLESMREEEQVEEPQGFELMRSAVQFGEQFAKSLGIKWGSGSSSAAAFNADGYVAGQRAPLHGAVSSRASQRTGGGLLSS